MPVSECNVSIWQDRISYPITPIVDRMSGSLRFISLAMRFRMWKIDWT